MNGHKPVKPIPASVWRLASMGVELAAAVGGGAALGYVIDRHMGTGHWALVIGALVGIVGGLYNMIRKAVLESLQMSRKTSPPKRRVTDRGEKGEGGPPETGGAP